MKILLIRNDNIGDLICSTPAIEALRKRYPEAQIDLLVNSYNAVAVQGNPFIDTLWVYTKTKHVKGFLAKARAFFHKGWLLYRLRQERYDVSVILRGAYSKHAELFSRVARAPKRLGVPHPQRADSLTHPIVIEGVMHEVMVGFECLKPLDVSYGKESPLWVVGEAPKRPFLEHQGKIIFHISSRLEGNRYPEESFHTLLESLHPHPCIITAAPSDKEMAQRLGQLPHVAFVPTANIQELAALISMGSLFVTLDGGALHMGSALDVPTLAILGKTDPRHWAPWGEKHRYLMQPLAPEEIRRAMAEGFCVL